MKKVLIAAFLLLLLLIGLWQRWEGIPNNHVLWLFDNARDSILAKNIVVNHKFYLIGPPSGGIAGYFHGVIWLYLLTIPFLIGQGSPIAFTMSVVLCSLGSILLAFWVTRKLAGLYPAFFVATLYTFATFNVATSRYTWNPYPIVWLMPLYFLLFYFTLHDRKYSLIGLSLLTSLFIQFEAIYGIALLVPWIYFLFRSIRTKKYQEFIFSIFVFLLPILPSVLFDLRHNFLISRSLLSVITSGGATITHKGSPTPFVNRIILRSNDLLTYTAFITINMYFNVFILCLFLYSFWKYKRDTFVLWIIGVLIIPFFIFLVLKYEVWSYYWIGNMPLFVLLFGYCLKKISPIIITLTCILIFLVFNPLYDISTHQRGYISDGATTLSTQEKVVTTIYQDAKGLPFSFYVVTPPVYDYTYQYLFWYEGKKLKQSFPIRAKQKLVYVIVEANPSDPNGLFFTTHVIHVTTTPIKIFTFPQVLVEKFITQSGSIDTSYFDDLLLH